MSIVDPDHRIDLVVLFGGRSAEHDVSCSTAAHVLRAADPTKYRITPVGIDRSGSWSISAEAVAALAVGPAAVPGRLDPTGMPVMPSDVIPTGSSSAVVMPLIHGPLGEDGTIQGLLEVADVAYVGSGVLASALAMDKAMTKQVLAANGIAQARHLSLRDTEITVDTAQRLANELGLPLFVKPANMGSSVGVSKAKSIDEVRAALDLAASYDEWIVIEEAISGREIEVAVLGNLDPRASLPGEVVPAAEFYDYADKYVDNAAEGIVPAQLDDGAISDVRRLAVEIFGILRCDGMARVDFFYEDGPGGRGFLCNEVNTIPGFTPISMYPKMWIATGMTYPGIIDELVRLALERHARRRRNTGP
jgi:D-alanine-D-alanine ligase